MKAYAIVLGGGSGTRMGAERNKVFLPLRGIPAIIRALAPFTALCAGSVVVARDTELLLMQDTLKRFGLSQFAYTVVAGGENRQASVAAAPSNASIRAWVATSASL